MQEFRILGPFEVVAADGEPLALTGRNQRTVLAVLLLRANHVVATDVLVDAVWGEHPPRTARTSLQNVIVGLRQLLGTETIETENALPGYRLVVDPESYDLARFQRLVAEARELEPEERAERLRDALELWRGEPLLEFRTESFAEADVRWLEELRLKALSERIDADLACERYSELVPELVALVGANPLDERLREQLMLAYYHSNRPDDAGRVYQDLRRALIEAVGREPGPQLQDLNRRIIQGEVPRPRRVVATPDDAHFEDVTAALLAGRVVPVLGTDVGSLAEQLASRFEYGEEAADLTRVAQFVALTKGPGPLYEELRALFASTVAPTQLHRFFASLPPLLRERGLPHQLLLTTSYDLALEQALLDAGEEFDVVSYIATGRDRGRFAHRDPTGATRVIELPNTYATELSLERRTVILKLHGGLDAAGGRESFVVTEDDYIGYLAHGDIGSAIPVGLAAKLRRSHFLFLGYGIREWSLRLVLDRICAGEALAFRSWAVLPAARPLERYFWRARDIDLLELPLDDYTTALGRHLGVLEEAAT
jgi:DNA-binding SARP family transcriptional activator